MNKENLNSLIESYIRAKAAGEFGEVTDYHELMEKNREWQLSNILDVDKLKAYSDSEFAEKFGEMFDYSDGDASSHALNRGMHFKTDESRIEVRPAFERAVEFIVNSDNDRFELLAELLDSNSPYKVFGIGSHMATTLINAKYPDVPPINGTTREFFNNIGEPLPTNISDAQHVVSDFFNEVIELSNGRLNYDDANHMLWYSSNTESGRRFMEQNFNVTFENKIAVRKNKGAARKKALTHEERVAEYFAHLQAIQNQSQDK